MLLGGPAAFRLGVRWILCTRDQRAGGGWLPEVCGAAQLLTYEQARESPELSKWEVLTSWLGLDLCSLNPQVGIHIARLPQEERNKALFPFLSCAYHSPTPSGSCTTWGPDPEKLTRFTDSHAGRVQELAVSPPCRPPGLPSAGCPVNLASGRQ